MAKKHIVKRKKSLNAKKGNYQRKGQNKQVESSALLAFIGLKIRVPKLIYVTSHHNSKGDPGCDVDEQPNNMIFWNYPTFNHSNIQTVGEPPNSDNKVPNNNDNQKRLNSARRQFTTRDAYKKILYRKNC
jgi:hypothetical protein